MGKKSNDEDHCTRQEHIMYEEAEEKGTPRRGDGCSCQTRCTQAQNVRTLPSSVNDSTDSFTDSSDSPTDSTGHHTYWQFD